MKPTYLKGILAAILGVPVVAFAAAPPATSAYSTDISNIYVEDQTSQVLASLNNVMCHVEAVRGDAMVNKGAYAALIDRNICEPNNNGGKQQNTGASYSKAILNSTRVDNNSPMLVDMWLDNAGNGGGAKHIYAHVSATQAPSPALIYGAFDVNYCGKSATTATTCDGGYGFVNSSASGLQYFAVDQWSPGAGATVQAINALAVNAKSATSGAGSLSASYAVTGTAPAGFTTPANLSIIFAYDANYFRRSDNSGVTSRCFDRALVNADISTWSYGLYDSTTGAHFDRNGGFPVEYTDAAGVLQNGYIGYWGLWTSALTPPASGTTLNKVTYGGAATPTKTAYTLLQTGGKLYKYTRIQKTLAGMNKVKFWYWSSTNIPATQPTAGSPAVGSIMAAGNNYEIYWDDTAKQFMVAGQMSAATAMMTPLANPVAIPNADMASANQYGLWGWTSMGGSFNIPGYPANAFTGATASGMANLAAGLSATPVIFNAQDVVYPSQYAALGGLKCISDCPTAAAITAAGAAASTSSPFGTTWSNSAGFTTVSSQTVLGSTTITDQALAWSWPAPFVGMTVSGPGIPVGATITAVNLAPVAPALPTVTISAAATATSALNGVALTFGQPAGLGMWITVPTANLTSYTLDPVTGNLKDAANGQVVVATAPTNGNTNFGWGTGQVTSGKMVAVTNNGKGDSLAELDAAKVTAKTSAGQYLQSDVDLITSYYQWNTSPNSWDQLSLLKDTAGAFVTFDPPLNVDFVVPANTKAPVGAAAGAALTLPYGSYAGTTVTLTYNGFGDLWGIPYACIDLTTNQPCNFAAAGANGNNPNWSWKPEFSIPTDAVKGVVTADAVAAKVAGATAGQTVTYLVKALDSEARFAMLPDATCTGAGLTYPNPMPPMPTATGFVDPTAGANKMSATPPTPANTAPRVIHGEVKY